MDNTPVRRRRPAQKITELVNGDGDNIKALRDLGLPTWAKEDRTGLRGNIAMLLSDYNEREKDKESQEDKLEAAQTKLTRRLNIIMAVAAIAVIFSTIASAIIVAKFFPNTVYVTAPAPVATPFVLPTPTTSIPDGT